MEYKGYSIYVAAFSELTGGFRATYAIKLGTNVATNGTIAGSFKTALDAEQSGYLAARRWIDEQPF